MQQYRILHYLCPNPRDGEHEWCVRCIEDDMKQRTHQAQLDAQAATIQAEDQALLDFPHWAALERFIAKEIDDAARHW